VRDAVLSSQVAGAVVSLSVKAGQRVQRGQELLRIDARAVNQQMLSSQAQMEATKASLHVAGKELERQKQLFLKQYISQAALERSQAQFESAQAQVQSLQAQTAAAQAQTGFFVIHAPFSGVISEVLVSLGDMAMPAKPMINMYDPSELRISAPVPQSYLSWINAGQAALRYEVTGLEGSFSVSRAMVKLLPVVDQLTHSAQLRVELKGDTSALVPGLFARVFLSKEDSLASQRPVKIRLPLRALVKRGEMTGVFVLDGQGQPRLRQVRVGEEGFEDVEILTGLSMGENVVLDPAQSMVNR
jgi:RND family efflux transporter MFP subunit